MRRLALTTVAALALGSIPSGARAEGVYWTTESLLRSFFADSEKVTYQVVETAAHRQLLRERVGIVPAKDRYYVFVARTGERVDGYAVIDTEKGQHQPITFGIQISPTGRVLRTEVMAYHEAYGEEIRAQRFRRQFEGKRSSDPVHLGDDIVAITGATMSSRSTTLAVRRALLLVELVQAPSDTSKAVAQRPPDD